jgi:hypothetical protein
MPTMRGWESAPGLHDTGISAPYDKIFVKTFFDGREEVLVRGAVTESGGLHLNLSILDKTGGLRVQETGTAPDPAIQSGKHWLNLGDMQAAALNGRLFFSAGGDGVYCLTRDVPNTGILVDQQHTTMDMSPYRLLKLHLAAGTNSVNWPYVTRPAGPGAPEALNLLTPFGAPNLCAHMQRLWFSGFEYGQRITFNQDLSSEQRYLAKDFLTDMQSTIRVNPQTIVWTDPDNPFSIGLPNFLQLNSSYPVKAMASFKDRLIIITSGDVWVLSGYREEEFTVRKIADNIGCQNAHTVAVSPNGVYFGNASGIFLTQGEEVVKVSEAIDHLFEGGVQNPQDSLLPTLDFPTRFTPDFGDMQYWTDRRELWVPVRCSPDGNFMACLVYSDETGEWTVVKQAGMTGGYEGVYSVAGNTFVIEEGGNFLRSTNQNNFRSTAHVITPQKALFLSKPLQRELTAWQNISALTLLWRKAPDGSAWTGGNYLWVYNEEEPWAGTGKSRSQFTGVPFELADEYQWNGSTWNGTEWTGIPVVHHTTPVGMLGNFVRLCMLTSSKQRTLLKGMIVHVRQVSPRGGE